MKRLAVRKGEWYPVQVILIAQHIKLFVRLHIPCMRVTIVALLIGDLVTVSLARIWSHSALLISDLVRLKCE